MARLTLEELRDILETRLRGQGLSEEDVSAKLTSFDTAWDDAHPRRGPESHPGEFYTGTLRTEYLCLPGCYSGAETAVLEFFGLLDVEEEPKTA